MKPRRLFWLIIILTLLAIFADLPSSFRLRLAIPKTNIKIDQEISRPKLDLKIGKFRFYRDLEIKKGIDLAGGTHLLFVADMSKIKEEDRNSALEAVKNNIERRINLFGVNEPLVQTSKVKDEYRLIVELPGITDINQAIELIGQTAQLDFRELPVEATTAASFADFKPTA
jgi:preprotein translocase subunit SecD